MTFFELKMVQKSFFSTEYEKNNNSIRFFEWDLGQKDNKNTMSKKSIFRKNQQIDYIIISPVWRKKNFSFSENDFEMLYFL